MSDVGSSDLVRSATSWIEMLLLIAPPIGALATAGSALLRRRRRADGVIPGDGPDEGRHGWPQALCEAIDHLDADDTGGR